MATTSMATKPSYRSPVALRQARSISSPETDQEGANVEFAIRASVAWKTFPLTPGQMCGRSQPGILHQGVGIAHRELAVMPRHRREGQRRATGVPELTRVEDGDQVLAFALKAKEGRQVAQHRVDVGHPVHQRGELVKSLVATRGDGAADERRGATHLGQLVVGRLHAVFCGTCARDDLVEGLPIDLPVLEQRRILSGHRGVQVDSDLRDDGGVVERLHQVLRILDRRPGDRDLAPHDAREALSTALR